jgi:hypothetical protein
MSTFDTCAEPKAPRAKGARKPAAKKRAAAKKASIKEMTADEYLRSSPANLAILTASLKAAKRGQLITFDPRKK